MEKHEKMAQLQVLQEQINQLKEFISQYDEQLNDINNLLSMLDEFKNAKKDQEIMVPITNGIFAAGKLTETSKLRVNVGQGVIVEKTIDETKELLEKQMKELEGARAQALVQFHEFVNYAQKMEED